MTSQQLQGNKEEPNENKKKKENIGTVILDLPREKKTGQSKWIMVDNNRKKIRLGVIYASK